MARRRRRGPGRYIALVLVLAVIGGLAAVAITVSQGTGRLSADGSALARITLPVGGGRIAAVSVVTGPHSQGIPVVTRGGRIWPQQTIPAGELVSIDVTIRRPGWISWLAGRSEHLRLSLQTPSAGVRAQYVTLGRGAPLRVSFTEPVSAIAFGAPGHWRHQTLAAPASEVTLPRSALAGSVWVRAVARPWESATATLVSWFPAGQGATVVASPAPGSTISPTSSIMLTFSKPVARALGSARPALSPATPGRWDQVSSHVLVFHPRGTGYGLGAHVSVALPAGVVLIGGSHGSAGTLGRWQVPRGSLLRLQQLLAELGYLPLNFHANTPVPVTATAQEIAAIHPPAGSFTWAYPNTPAALTAMWSPGSAGEMTRGAVMAFENDHGLAADGDPGPLVWKTLLGAVLAGQRSHFGYSFVEVSKGAQHLTLWHNGQTVVTTAVNTGIAAAPTASGTFAVYEHLRVTTMSGTNPDGSHYHDPGIQFVSYFNGGDALHAFTRAQYGFPQSLGCVEMALGPAGQVWPYTPIGTLVHVA
jgi:peptidoglycan hydrolase-like protein with peptidoglycan-binding domain